MKNIYLVQRGTIRKPYNYHKGTLSKGVSFDYMGSAEFEFGALAESLQYMKDNIKKYSMSKWNGCYKPNYSLLHIWHPFGEKTEELEKYKEMLSSVFEGNARLKEGISFKRNLSYDRGDDFWWDVTNNVMWSYDKWFMNHLPEALEQSFKILQTSR